MSREELLDFDRLLQCDDWFLMNIIGQTRMAPEELRCGVLLEMQEMLAPNLPAHLRFVAPDPQ